MTAPLPPEQRALWQRLAREAREAYSAVAFYPETRSADGLMDLLRLRNFVPALLEALEEAERGGAAPLAKCKGIDWHFKTADALAAALAERDALALRVATLEEEQGGDAVVLRVKLEAAADGLRSAAHYLRHVNAFAFAEQVEIDERSARAALAPPATCPHGEPGCQCQAPMDPPATPGATPKEDRHED